MLQPICYLLDRSLCFRPERELAGSDLHRLINRAFQGAPNNLAERSLRGFVIWRKISFGTQSARGSRYVERIMTVAGSCRLQGRNLLDFLTQVIQAHWGKGIMPSLVPSL